MVEPMKLECGIGCTQSIEYSLRLEIPFQALQIINQISSSNLKFRGTDLGYGGKSNQATMVVACH